MSAPLSECPLVTEYTRRLGVPDKTLELLHRVRAHNPEDGPIPISFGESVRKTHKRTKQPINIRNYQTQGIAHLIKMGRFIQGDAVGLGKTIQAAMATAYLYDKTQGKLKTIILATKSTTYQFSGEVEDFTRLRCHVTTDTYKKMSGSPARLAQIKDFLEGKLNKEVLVVKYTSLVGRRKKVTEPFDEDGNPQEIGSMEKVSQEIRDLCAILEAHSDNLLVIADEAHKFKEYTSQIRNLMVNIQVHVPRLWAMTATAIQNNLEEFYAIASAIGIKPFGSPYKFKENFCIYRRVHVGKGRFKPELVGYKNVKEFKIGIRPFFLGRSQTQVKEPLPKLTTVYHPVELDKKQTKLLLEDIPQRKVLLPPSITKYAGEIYTKERDPDNQMTMMSVMQMITNHSCFLDPSDEKKFYTSELSPKEEMLLELLDGELYGEKVVVFTKSRTWIDRFERITREGHFTSRKFLRITGNENEKQRHEAKTLFQNNPEYDLLFINTAASEGVNLQQSAHMVMLDVLWSWGMMLQTVGRIVRMSSPHSACTLHLIPAKGSIDEFAIETLKGKKGVFEIVLGESHSAGILDSVQDLDLAAGMEKLNDDAEFRKMLKAHVKSVSMKEFIKGDFINEAADNTDYKMTFQKTKAEKRKAKTELDFSKWSME